MALLYFDYNASSPPWPEVLDRVADLERGHFGNPSSLHSRGRDARKLLEESRESIAAELGGKPIEFVFTSGGTEANRLALEGVLAGSEHRSSGPPHAVVNAMEHPSVLDVCRWLAERGRLDVTYVNAPETGRVPAQAIAEAVRENTALVSLQHSNNETGVLQDLPPVAEVCRRGGVTLHVDAVQSLGKVPLDLDRLGADLVSLSSHKIGGPKGAGALWIRRDSGFRSPWVGGPQEQNRRPGTENLPAIGGFVLAVQRALSSPMPCLGGRLWQRLRDEIPDVLLNGAPDHLLPNTRNISFQGVSAEDLLIRLDLEGVAASSGSACASGSREPSHVLRAMGFPQGRIRSAVRFSWGWQTRPEDVDRLIEILRSVVCDLRRLR